MVRPEVKKRRRELAAAAVQSRKTRKKLEKIVLHKKSKLDRVNLLAELKKYQLQPHQLEQLHSTSAVQTKGLKKFLNNDAKSARQRHLGEVQIAEQCLDAATLIKKKRRKKPTPKLVDPSSSSSEDTDAFSTDAESCNAENVTSECSHEPSTPNNSLDILSDKTSQPQANIPVKQDQNLNLVVLEKSNAQPEKKEKAKLMVSQPAVNVAVIRRPDIEEARLKLPIIGEEQQIVEKIRYNNIVIVSGETGSGKTTQIPQFLYEAGYALNNRMIGITEPRRVAAVSMSERVADELNLSSKEVSYHIRFSSNLTEETKIKFMTDGVLLRQFKQDSLLSRYSAIIIDEAHERSVDSDILIGLLSRIVLLRAKRGDPLKLIIMSATLRVTDFTQNSFLFKQPPPVINIDARQFPVTINFAKRTPSNYLEAAYRKACSIHSRLPKGGILIFVTSQIDVKVLVKKLKSHVSSIHDNWTDSESENEDGVLINPKTPMHCLGLYAMLPLEKQRLVFKNPPEGTRLCVVATNVAETSITIPNIKYVIDTGLEKKKVYDPFTGVSKFITTWTSKSSAEQRTGRAGRIGPGQCFRLYSSAVFTNDFPDHSEPHVLQKPLEDVILQMKSMNIDNVVNFPFPTRPTVESLKEAEKKLIALGALDDSKIKNARFKEFNKIQFSSRLTPLGKAMSRFSLSARCSKMVVLSPTELLPHVICLVAALTVREMFTEAQKWNELRRKWVGKGSCRLLGDFSVMIRAVRQADKAGCTNKFCHQNGLRTKAMLEIDKLRTQLTNEINKNLKHSLIRRNRKLTKLSDDQANSVRKLMFSSFSDHVARRIPDAEVTRRDPLDPSKVIKKKLKHAYECKDVDHPVYISTESVLKGRHPDYVIYRELYKSDKKTYMRDVAVVNPDWLPE